MAKTYRVTVPVILTLEVEALSEAHARQAITEAFEERRPVDPLAEFRFDPEHYGAFGLATIKTCVAREAAEAVEI